MAARRLKQYCKKYETQCFQCAQAKLNWRALNNKMKHLLSKGKNTVSLYHLNLKHTNSEMTITRFLVCYCWIKSCPDCLGICGASSLFQPVQASYKPSLLTINSNVMLRFIEKRLNLASSVDLCCLLAEESQYYLWNLDKMCKNVTESQKFVWEVWVKLETLKTHIWTLECLFYPAYIKHKKYK